MLALSNSYAEIIVVNWPVKFSKGKITKINQKTYYKDVSLIFIFFTFSVPQTLLCSVYPVPALWSLSILTVLFHGL